MVQIVVHDAEGRPHILKVARSGSVAVNLHDERGNGLTLNTEYALDLAEALRGPHRWSAGTREGRVMKFSGSNLGDDSRPRDAWKLDSAARLKLAAAIEREAQNPNHPHPNPPPFVGQANL